MALPVMASDIAAYNVQVNDQYVSGDFRCSCSYGTWNNHIHAAFVNYCPGCGRYGTLSYECHGADYPDYARSDEGMWYCDMEKGGCDRDFCGQCGFTHGKYNYGNWLTPYDDSTPPPTNAVVVNAVDKKVEVLDRWYRFKETAII